MRKVTWYSLLWKLYRSVPVQRVLAGRDMWQSRRNVQDTNSVVEGLSIHDTLG